MFIENLINSENFHHHYQPIYNIKDHSIIGYEGLFRSSYHSNPEETFYEAKKEEQLYALDSRSLHKAVLTYSMAGFSKIEGSLFLNVFPSTILNENFPSIIKKIMNDKYKESQDIVLEISEHELISDFDAIKSCINTLRKQGFRFAIDDFGKGNSDFKSIIELEPDYIKIDRYFASNLNTSKKKQTIINLLLFYCETYNIKLILEGIENELELATAASLGLIYAQGYLLGRPALLMG